VAPVPSLSEKEQQKLWELYRLLKSVLNSTLSTRFPYRKPRTGRVNSSNQNKKPAGLYDETWGSKTKHMNLSIYNASISPKDFLYFGTFLILVLLQDSTNF
jgi:hypothetical protein